MEFVTVFLRNGFPSSDDELDKKYIELTGKKYNGCNHDIIMLDLIQSHGQIDLYYYTVKIRRKFLPYCITNNNFLFDTIHFDFNKYKVDEIKKILSSESESKVEEIEMLIFSTFNEDEIIIR